MSLSIGVEEYASDRDRLGGGWTKPERCHHTSGRIEFHMGDVVSVVGPTGSGKTTLINDMELLAAGNTPTGVTCCSMASPLMPQGAMTLAEPIALITQHTTSSPISRCGSF